MKTIKCVCGEEILFLPDLKEMSKAIENHVNQKHSRQVGIKKGIERVHIRSYLSQEVLKAASQTLSIGGN